MSDTFVIAADESRSLVCAWSGSARAVLTIDADGAALVPGPWRGKLADLAVWDVTSPCELAYYLGLNRLTDVFYHGEPRQV